MACCWNSCIWTIPNQVEVSVQDLRSDLLECCDEVCNSLSMIHSAHRNDGGMLDGGGRYGIKRGQPWTLQGAIVNHAYLRFLNSHRPHRSTHGLTHNDDSVC